VSNQAGRPRARRADLARVLRAAGFGVAVLLVMSLPFPVAAWVGPAQAGGIARAGQSTARAIIPTDVPDADLDTFADDVLSPVRAAAGGLGSEVDPSAGWGGSLPLDDRLAVAQAAPDEAAERLSTLERLLATDRPARDPVALAGRLRGVAVPWAAMEPVAGPLDVGRQDTFYVLDQTDSSYKARVATLRLVSEQAYWYVEDGQRVSDDDIATAAGAFDQQTVPTIRRIFGTEWLPGIDGDARVTIFLGTAPGVSAYFSSWDEYPRSVYRYSNEREMIHVNVGSTRPGSQSFNGTMAHELQHMVHWHLNPLDDTWLDEGLAELAAALAVPGYRPNTGTFQRQPDVQLTAWSQGTQTSAHYQASYLFMRYFAQRFGEGAIAKLLAEPGRPPDTITASLSRSGMGVTFDDVFEDWLVANLLDDPAVGDGRYAHVDLDHRAAVGLTLSPDGTPTDQTVRQYGARYIELQGTGADAELSFTGAPAVKLVGTDATSGRSAWWSNRADGLDTTLTRRFDLRGVSSATLNFNLWYDTERGFDFFYVLASTDGGTRWQVLHGANADNENPTGNAIGAGYSGRSGVTDGQRGDPRWIAETVDVSPFAGGDVLVRFEYVTDQGYNARGVLVDDVAIPEIGFADDAESETGWIAAGFLRSENVIPQTWSVQLVEQRAGLTTVRPLRTDESGRVVERLPNLGGSLERAVLVVSGLAPRTLEAAPFSVTLRPAP
jgi:immune inhibitor A